MHRELIYQFLLVYNNSSSIVDILIYNYYKYKMGNNLITCRLEIKNVSCFDKKDYFLKIKLCRKRINVYTN